MSDLHDEVAPLSKEESAWIKKLERVLLSCPSRRLGLATIGDAGLDVFDDEVARRHDIPIEDGGIARHGVSLGHVKSRPTIHGISG
ncbi:MAG: hypothetical protein ABJF67_08020 [Aurantimonas coralicida]